MTSGFSGVVVGCFWIALAVVGVYGIAAGGWRVMGRRSVEDFGLLLTGCTAFVLFALLGIVMK